MKMNMRRHNAMSYIGSQNNFTRQNYARAFWAHIAYGAPTPNESIYDEKQCSLKDREKIRKDLIGIKS